MQVFRNLRIGHGLFSLYQGEDCPDFCTPLGAELVGRIGCDGVHVILLPGDERVYCVDPMGGSHVLPVGTDFREFVSFLRDANPLSPLSWLGEEAFRELLREDRGTGSSLGPEVLEKREQALAPVDFFCGKVHCPFT